ncbi:MAG: hypothetical protein WKG00_02960 [Polyangiaceae bacterium]
MIAGALAAMLVGGVIAVRVVGTSETAAAGAPSAQAALPEPPIVPTEVSAPRPEVAPLPGAGPSASAVVAPAGASASAASSSAIAAPTSRATPKPGAGPRPTGAAPAASPGIATKGEFKP